MRTTFLRSFSIPILFCCTLSFGTLASASDSPSSELLLERAKVCGPLGEIPFSLVLQSASMERDPYAVTVTLIYCDDAYLWYEGVCGPTEWQQMIVFSAIDGSLLSGPASCR